MKNKIFHFSLKNIIFAGVVALITLIFSIAAIGFRPLEGLDNSINDGLYQHKSDADKRITIVGIDEETINTYDAYNAIEYREYFANILNAWADKGYKPTIGFDIIFNKQYGCDDVDEKLRDALKKHDVILGVNGMSRTEAPYGLSPTVYEGAKGIGFVDAITDNDEAIRRTYLKSDNYDSLAYSLYSSYCDKNPDVNKTEYQKKKAYYFNYYAAPELITLDGKTGVATSGFDYISMKDLLDSYANGDILTPRGKILVFGSYASAVDTGLSNDIYNSPIGEMFGMEVQCNIIQSLLNGKLYTPTPVYLSTIINTILIFGIVLLMTSVVFYLGIAVFALGIGLEFIMSLIMHSSGSCYFISTPLLIIFLAFVVMIILHYYNEYKHKREVIGTFKRYISPDVAEALVDNDQDAMSLGGRKRNVACLFVDIRGFTKMSEELQPEEVVDILNGYLEMATNQVFRFGGMVDKFIGDCVMAIFNAPVDLDDYIFKAVCAAFGIVKEGKAICDQVLEKYNKKLEFGVGVHYGDAVIGNIGSKTRMDFTAIGDTVNTASRIEASAGGSQVLISSFVYDVIKDRVKVVDAGDRMFKNKKEPIKCYEVVEIEGYDSFSKE